MNKKSYLSRVRLPRTPAEWLEAVMNFIFFLCGMLAVGCVVLISVYMVISGVPAIHKIGLFQFLFGTKWASTAAQPLFGILPEFSPGPFCCLRQNAVSLSRRPKQHRGR